MPCFYAMNKIKVALLCGVSGIVALISGLGIAKAEIMSSSTLATQIDTVNTTFMDYLSVLITNYWPFLLGAIVLAAVWAFGRRIWSSFT